MTLANVFVSSIWVLLELLVPCQTTVAVTVQFRLSGQGVNIYEAA
jgi:hypothetical protein